MRLIVVYTKLLVMILERCVEALVRLKKTLKPLNLNL